jgi:DNA-binding protein YbaB
MSGCGVGAVTTADQLTGSGVAAGGRIKVVAASGYLIRAELDRGVIRLRPDILADELTKAVNSALEDARPAVPVPDVPGLVDLDVVARDFTAVRDQASRLMTAIVSEIQDATADLVSEGKLPAGVSVPDPTALLETMARVDSLLSGAGGPRHTHDAQARGAGQAGGLVRAVAVPPGRLGHLEIDPGAAPVGPDELAQLVVGAVNTALDSLEQSQREQRTARAAHGAELKQHFQAMNDAALAIMEDFGSAASWVMQNTGRDVGIADEAGLPGRATD